MGLRDLLGPSRRELHRALIEAKAELEKASAERARLEGLLDVAGDIDSKLAGASNSALFRRLFPGSGPVDGGRDFDEGKRNELIALSHRTYALRPTAHDLVDTHLDFLLGEDGIRPLAVKAEDKTVQAELDEIWYDDHNRINDTLEEKILTMMIEGELFLFASFNPTDGRLELGPLMPEEVTGIVRNRFGADVALTLASRATAILPEDAQQIFLLHNLSDRIEINPVNGPKGEKWLITERRIDRVGLSYNVGKMYHGLGFAWFGGRTSLNTRGRPILTDSLDYIDMHDQHLWSTLEREKLLRNFVLHVRHPDITDDNSRAKLKKLNLDVPPTGPTVVATNDKVELKMMQAKVEDGTFGETERVMRMLAYGGKGMPEHWSGSGADSNLSTAQAQEGKPLRRMRRVQQSVLRFWRDIVRVSIELKARAGTGSKIEPKLWRMDATEIGGKDRQRGSDVLQKVAVSVSAMAADRVISREAAHEMVLKAAKDAGYEVSVENAELPEELELDPNDLLDALDTDSGTKNEPGERAPRGAASKRSNA